MTIQKEPKTKKRKVTRSRTEEHAVVKIVLNVVRVPFGDVVKAKREILVGCSVKKHHVGLAVGHSVPPGGE